MLENILPEFQKFLTSCGIADEKHAPFYARWVALKGNFRRQADFLKNTGSNFFLKDLTLLVSRNYVFKIIAESDLKKNWRRSCDEIRTYFKGFPLK